MLNESPNATFFHTPNWARILTKAFGYRTATRLYQTEEGEVLIPLMEMERFGLKALASMPLGYGGIFPSTTSETIREIFAYLLHGRVLRLYFSQSPLSPQAIPISNPIERHETDWDHAHLLDLSGGQEAMSARIGKNLRRDIRYAEKHGVEVVPSNTLEGYREFYEIYTARSTEWGYTEPPYSFKLCEAVYTHGRPYARLNLAKREGETIGGEISFMYGNVPFGWVLAVAKENTRYFPGPLLQYHALLEACESGCPTFNMGSSGRLDSVRSYKTRWGATEVAVPHYLCRSRLDRLLHPVQSRILSAHDRYLKRNGSRTGRDQKIGAADPERITAD